MKNQLTNKISYTSAIKQTKEKLNKAIESKNFKEIEYYETVLFYLLNYSGITKAKLERLLKGLDSSKNYILEMIKDLKSI